MLKQWQSDFILVFMNNKDGYSSCHGLVHDVAVGALIRQETDFKSLNQAEKLNIIDNHFRPAEDYVFPKVSMNGCNRSFQRSWQQRYPWLVYSIWRRVLFTMHFVCHTWNLGTLVMAPFNRWTKVSKVCGEHEKHHYHLDAMVAYDSFFATSRRSEKSSPNWKRT